MKIVDFIVAEDIRAELGDKYSIMGVFADVISINAPPGAKWPLPFRLSSFVRLQWGPSDPKTFRFVYKIKWENEDVAKFEGEGTVGQETQLVTLPLVGNVPLKGSGSFSFALELFDGERLLLSEALRPVRVAIEAAQDQA